LKQLLRKKSLNPIPKTLRGKKRFIAVRFLAEKPLDFRSVIDSILFHHQSLFGAAGVAKARLSVVWFDSATQAAIVRCSADALLDSKAGLVLLSKIGNTPVIPVLMGVSGSLSKLKSKLG